MNLKMPVLVLSLALIQVGLVLQMQPQGLTSRRDSSPMLELSSAHSCRSLKEIIGLHMLAISVYVGTCVSHLRFSLRVRLFKSEFELSFVNPESGALKM